MKHQMSNSSKNLRTKATDTVKATTNQINKAKIPKCQQSKPWGLAPKEVNYQQKQTNNTLNTSTTQSVPQQIQKQTTPNLLKMEIANWTSIYNALQYTSLQIDKTFQSQRINAEGVLNGKTWQALKLKDENFKQFSKYNSMSNISNIDDYWINNYEKITETCPKICNIIENMNDFVSNINYGLDRMYLDGNITCDTTVLSNNIKETTDHLDTMNKALKERKNDIFEMKNKYESVLEQIMKTNNWYTMINEDLKKYKSNFLSNNIEGITQELIRENKALLYNIIND